MKSRFKCKYYNLCGNTKKNDRKKSSRDYICSSCESKISHVENIIKEGKEISVELIPYLSKKYVKKHYLFKFLKNPIVFYEVIKSINNLDKDTVYLFRKDINFVKINKSFKHLENETINELKIFSKQNKSFKKLFDLFDKDFLEDDYTLKEDDVFHLLVIQFDKYYSNLKYFDTFIEYHKLELKKNMIIEFYEELVIELERLKLSFISSPK